MKIDTNKMEAKMREDEIPDLNNEIAEAVGMTRQEAKKTAHQSFYGHIEGNQLLVDDSLEQKTQTHGVYEEVANIQDGVLAVMEQSRNWPHMPPAYRGAVRQIANLFGRIGSGDMHLSKHWSDGVNYMRLALMTAEGRQPQDKLARAYGDTKLGTVATRPSVEAPLAAQEAGLKTSTVMAPSGIAINEASYRDPNMHLWDIRFDDEFIGRVWAHTMGEAVQVWVKRATGEWPVSTLSKKDRAVYLDRFVVILNPEGAPSESSGQDDDAKQEAP